MMGAIRNISQLNWQTVPLMSYFGRGDFNNKYRQLRIKCAASIYDAYYKVSIHIYINCFLF